MKILYLLRAEYGLLGTSASFKIPKIVSERHDVRVLSAEAGNDALRIYDEQMGNVFHAPDKSVETRARHAEEVLDGFQPDIIHAFFFRDVFELLDRLVPLFNHRPKLIIDVRSPLLIREWGNRVKYQMRTAWKGRHVDLFMGLNAAVVDEVFPMVGRTSFAEVPTGLDLEMFSDVVADHTPRPLRRFVYSGSIAHVRKLEEMARLFHGARRISGLPLELHVYGGGNALEHLKDLSATERLRGIYWHGPVRQSELARRLSRMDAGLNFMQSRLYDNAMTLKSLEYAAVRLPVISSTTTRNAILSRMGYPLIQFDNQPASLHEALEPYLRDDNAGLWGYLDQINISELSRLDWRTLVRTKVEPEYRRLLIAR